MKEKILLQLKDAVKNSTFSERTFSEVADAITRAITNTGIEENKAGTFLNDLATIFNTFQGDVNRQIVEAVKKSELLEKEKIGNKKTSGKRSKPEISTNKPLTAKDIALIVTEANKPLLEKIKIIEAGSRKLIITEEVKRQLKTQYKLNEDLCDKIIGYLDIGPESTVEKITKNVLKEYNELATSFGLLELIK
ncbi:phage tail tape measure protein [Dysgonomonas sp. HDW5B]|uniref:phage tail tape measure protein n=1 Tax=Dysgonomonas sp. HDW5B TaxID=2714927 RepID=UPI0014082530|nr:phage tail tape measure protein [Dysgonomonas sp. HDW5B]QIK52931.1 phage tail tape measure protein [Dysgonomonas sp. HDW5B]